jgi:GTP cyclohydrolase I
MFCEDAARRIRGALEGDHDITAYRVRVEHQESLHPHDAVAEVHRDFPASAHGSGFEHGSFT